MYCSMLSRAPAQVHGQPAHALSRGGVHHRVVPQGEHVQLESGHSGSYTLLEDTARYAGLLLAPAEGFGRGFFLAFWQKKGLLCCFGPFLAIFGVQ